MTDRQEKDLAWWSHLTKGKDYQHLEAWRREIVRTKGSKEAELFVKRVNYVNGKKVL